MPIEINVSIYSISKIESQARRDAEATGPQTPCPYPADSPAARVYQRVFIDVIRKQMLAQPQAAQPCKNLSSSA